jgi:hypothetical protein
LRLGCLGGSGERASPAWASSPVGGFKGAMVASSGIIIYFAYCHAGLDFTGKAQHPQALLEGGTKIQNSHPNL